MEILGGLQQRLSTELSARVSQEMETLTRVKTLSGIIDRLLTKLSKPAAAASPPATVAKETAVSAPRAAVNAVSQEPLSRLSVTASEQPLPDVPNRTLSGLVVITEDELSVASQLALLLEQRGASCTVVSRSQLKEGGDAVAAAVAKARRAGVSLTGIVHLAALGRGRAIAEAAEWHGERALGVNGLFHVLHACAGDFADGANGGRQFVVAASALGGRYGRGDAVAISAVPGGGAHGLLKVAKKEWPGLRAISLDFDAGRGADQIARQICDEILSEADFDEVGYPGGSRTIFRPVLAPLADAGMAAVEPQADWVVLATGGARGITAELLHTVARKGMRLVLVGRSPLPGPEEDDTRGLDGAELRKALSARAVAANAARTPAAINRQAQRVLAEREMRHHLARLGEIATVEYRSVDVRDIDAFGSAIDDIYRTHGRIDAVLHGAGIIEDKLIRDKLPDSFDRVVATKADSVFALARHLRPDSLKLLVLFGSVAGRFGNPGQGDYAAANEVLNRMAWHLRHEWPEVRVVAINWGPWADSGMASEAVQRELRARGIEPIATVDGAGYFTQELRHGRPDDVELIIGSGPWVPPRGADAVPQIAAPQVVDTAKANGHAGHFLFDAPKLASDRSMTVEHEFDLDLHRYLADYRPENAPVLPATAALEWMAQFVELAWSDWKVQAIDDLRVVQGIRLVKGEPVKVLFRARASSHADAEVGEGIGRSRLAGRQIRLLPGRGDADAGAAAAGARRYRRPRRRRQSRPRPRLSRPPV